MVRSFLPVGQGAFYCECFEKDTVGDYINIVYDCGSLTSLWIVEQAIQNNFQKGETIDALFISHLDEDHINGIPFLLKYCKVKRIYFPLISPEDKHMMEINYSVTNASDFTYSFFQNPNQAIRLLQIDYLPEMIPVRAIEQEYSDSDMEQRVSGENVFEDIMGNKVYQKARCKKWMFIPFNFRQKERMKILLDNLQVQFERVVTEKDLVQMWRNNYPGDRDKIKAAYKKVPGGLNTNSMTLFSGEINNDFRQFISSDCGKCCPKCGYYNYKPSGCLYTGDYDASGSIKWEQLRGAYKKYWKYIGCVQIPHHGSKHNFNCGFLEMNAFFVVSAGYKNKYLHPHANVIKEFLLKSITPYIVTEQVGSAMHFLVE